MLARVAYIASWFAACLVSGIRHLEPYHEFAEQKDHNMRDLLATRKPLKDRLHQSGDCGQT